MEKSIESIWTNGFMNSDELKAPKILDLYNQKSKLLIEKLKKTYKTDNKSLLPIAILLGIGFSFFGHFLLGIYLMILIISLFFFNKKLLQNLEKINITTNSFDYLVTYRKTVKKITSATTKLLGLGLPLAIIPGYWFFFKNKEVYTNLIDKTTPFYLILMIIGFAIVLSSLGILVYKITTKIIYSKHLNRLDEIISDMKNLK